MNKRQAKKAFKKKYGCNPKEFEKYIDESFSKIDFEALGEVLGECLNELAKRIQETIPKVMNELCESIRMITKEIQEHPELLEKLKEEGNENDNQ